MTTRPDGASSQALVRMLEHQLALVEQLGVLAERQSGFIDTGDSDALLTLLSQRQQVMDQFTASQDELAALSEACQASPSPVDAGTRARIAALVDDISARLGSIMQRDEFDRNRLEASRNQVGESLVGLSTARAARDAYVRARAVTNRFADRQG